MLVSAPMVHGSGLMTFLACVSFGATVVMVERFDPDIVLDQIQAHGYATSGLPFMFHALVERQRSQQESQFTYALLLRRRCLSNPAPA